MKHHITTVIVAAAVALAIGFIPKTANKENGAPVPAEETAYERVLRTGVLRCGYFTEPPFTAKDENTGEFSGLSVDLVKAVASELDLKLEWSEQISFATFPQDLKNRRYDMVCGSVFILPRGGQMDYTIPYAYVSMQGYVRPEDTRFDKPFGDVEWENVSIAGLDGEGATTAAQKLLPQAKMNILPQLSNISEMLLHVSTGKSDISFVLPSVFDDFNIANPGQLRPAALDRPLYTYAVGFGISSEEPGFKAMIDNVLTQMETSGELESLFRKHDPKGHFKRPVVSME